MTIRDRRELCGIGQKHLVRVMGVTQTAIAKREPGIAYPSADRLPVIKESCFTG